MQYGICTSIASAHLVKETGWDYIEVPAKELLQQEVERSPLPVLAANLLVPPALKITGPDVRPDELFGHLSRVIDRASQLGVKVLVFGSGGARNVPEGFDRNEGIEQLFSFCRRAADMAAKANVLIALEHLNSGECNIVKSVVEATLCVDVVDKPSFGLLLDTYHYWVEDEPMPYVEVAAKLRGFRHMHVADKDGRVPPGESKTSNYRPLFRILKSSGYDSRISVEGNFPDRLIRERGAQILDYLKREWQES
jgi:sugar phosphate isomerase/epimerase